MTKKTNSLGPLSVRDITELSVKLLDTHSRLDDAMDLMGICHIDVEMVAEQLASDCGVVWCYLCGWVELDDGHGFWSHNRKTWPVSIGA